MAQLNVKWLIIICMFAILSKKKWGALLIHTLVRTNLIKIVLWRALFRKWF
jgi:hypothetical protein